MKMDNNAVIQWLLDNDNPAVKYRTQTEILGEAADKEPIIAWVNNFLPADWKEREGLWSTYYLTTIAECGLTFEDVPLNKEKVVNFGNAYIFEHGCGDYMRLRALVRLGLVAEPDVASIIGSLSEKQLPDGGFLCLHRVDKMNRVPKSCVKANMLALMFCAECRKKGIKVDIEKPLLDYFWNHNIFYRTDNHETLILNAREGWRTIDTFYPFEVMRVGLENVVEAFCALGYGNDSRLTEAWNILDSKRTPDGKYTLNGTLTKSYLPKERVGKPSKWVTFYALLAQKGMASVQHCGSYGGVDMNIEIKKLSPDLATDYFDFFENRAFTDDSPYRCYCQMYQMSKEQAKAAFDNATGLDAGQISRKVAQQQIDYNILCGYLAFVDDVAIGWCNANDRANFPIEPCTDTHFYAPAEKREKAVVCFEIAPEYRGKGVATALLSRVCEDAKAEGYTAVVGFPVIRDERYEWDCTGPVRLFEKCGFERLTELDGRVVMRKILN